MKPKVGLINTGNRNISFRYKTETIQLAPGQKTTKIYKEELLVITDKKIKIMR